MKVSRIAVVLGLSLLTGSGWLLTEAYPSEIGFPFAGCIHFAVIATLALPFADWNGGSRRTLGSIAAAGLAIFVFPGMVGALTAGAVSPSANIALFCAIPLMVVLGSAYSGLGSGRELMIPALAGLFGALLIFSIALPHSMRQTLGLAALAVCCALVALASVWAYKLLLGASIAAALALVGSAGAVTLGSYGLLVGWPGISLTMLGLEVVRSLVFDLPIVWITLWLMREIPPARVSSRFLLAPVVTWLEGYAMVRGQIEFRSLAALVCMALAASLLLVKEESDEVPGLRLR